MMPERNTILVGDTLETMRTWPDKFVQCVVTSPPYYALRDYGTGTWEGGDATCQHTCSGQVPQTLAPDAITTGIRPGCDTRTCKKCGALRVDKQIGLEQSPEAYVAKLVEVFREVRRILRDDGTCWLNLGSSYAGSGGPHEEHHANPGISNSAVRSGDIVQAKEGNAKISSGSGLKAKDLIGVPWMVAFALQRDGWYLRSEIIWHKPNPMPASVLDRPTTSHEQIFLLTKSPQYFYDNEAIKEPATHPTTKKPDGWDTGPGAHGTIHRNGREKGAKVDKQRGYGHLYTGFNARWAMAEMEVDAADMRMRNKRSVWTVSTRGFSDAHFATFPPALITPCILAGTSGKGSCATCGAPWERRLERESHYEKREPSHVPNNAETKVDSTGWEPPTITEMGWEPTCSCPVAKLVPSIVFDPFMGAGTTALVSLTYGRSYLGTELNPKYAEMAERRIADEQMQPKFNFGI